MITWILLAVQRTRGQVQRSPWLQTGVPAAIVLVCLVAMGRLIIDQYNGIAIALGTMRPEFVVAGLLTMIAASLGGGFFWKIIVSSCGADLTLKEAVRIWCLSNTAKYGLGAISQYGGRAYLAERADIPRLAVLLSLGLEVFLILVSGLVILLLLAPIGGRIIFPLLPTWSLSGAPVAGVLIVVVLPRLVRRGLTLIPRQWTVQGLEMNYPRLRQALAVVLLNWLLLGTSCFLVARAMTHLPLGLYPYVTFVVTLAMLAGLIAVAPLGLGVRDVVMAVALAHVIPPPIAVTAALLHRFLGVIAEFLCTLAVLMALSPNTSAIRKLTTARLFGVGQRGSEWLARVSKNDN